MTSRPFRDLGQALGLDEEEVIERLAGLQKEGLVRRIGPILDLRKLGRSGILAALRSAPRKRRMGRPRWLTSTRRSRTTICARMRAATICGSQSRQAKRESRKYCRRSGYETGRKMLVLPTVRIFKIGVKFDII